MQGRHTRIAALSVVLLSGGAWRGGGHGAVGIHASAPAVSPSPARVSTPRSTTPSQNPTPSKNSATPRHKHETPSHAPESQFQSSPGTGHDDFRRDRHRRHGFIDIASGYYGGYYGGDGTSTPTSETSNSTPVVPPQSNVPVGESSVDSRVKSRPTQSQQNGQQGQPQSGTKGRLGQVDPALLLAIQDVDAARLRLNQLIKSKPEYQAAAVEKKAAQDEAASLHESNASIERIMPVAQRALEASKRMTEVERQAEYSDPRIIAARANLEAALATLNGLRPVQ